MGERNLSESGVMSTGKMRAAMFYEPQVIRLVEVDIPEIGPEDVLVRVKTALTCGTDLKMYRRGHSLASRLPMTIGHEFAGVVEDVGEKVLNFRRGMRVVAANSAPCNLCFYCKLGKQNLCERLTDNLIGFSIPGAYAEYIRIPSAIVKHNTYILPESVPFEEAAILEPLACVVHGNELTGMELGDTVVILGAGPIGLLHLQLAKRKGVQQVVVLDLVESRLELASRLGADITIDIAKEDYVEKVKKLTENRGADVVVEAVGSSEAWQNAVKMTRKGGTVVLFGGCPPNTSIPLSADNVHYDELTLRGVFHHTPLTVRKALNLILAKVVDIKPLISGEMSLGEVDKALETMAKGRSIKVAIIP